MRCALDPAPAQHTTTPPHATPQSGMLSSVLSLCSRPHCQPPYTDPSHPTTDASQLAACTERQYNERYHMSSRLRPRSLYCRCSENRTHARTHARRARCIGCVGARARSSGSLQLLEHMLMLIAPLTVGSTCSTFVRMLTRTRSSSTLVHVVYLGSSDNTARINT